MDTIFFDLLYSKGYDYCDIKRFDKAFDEWRSAINDLFPFKRKWKLDDIAMIGHEIDYVKVSLPIICFICNKKFIHYTHLLSYMLKDGKFGDDIKKDVIEDIGLCFGCRDIPKKNVE